MKMMLNDKLYNILKWIVIAVLPALGVFVAAICHIWGFPYGEQIKDTLYAIELCIGGVLGISTHAYNKNKINEK